METNELIELGKNVLMNSYSKPNFILDKGEGSYVWDKEGKKYLDLISGIATCTIGHSNPELKKTISEQAEKLINTTNLFHTEPQILLGKKFQILCYGVLKV